MPSGDHGSDATLLLELDGAILVVAAEGNYTVRFTVHRVPPSPAQPHGLDYSLSLSGHTSSEPPPPSSKTPRTN